MAMAMGSKPGKQLQVPCWERSTRRDIQRLIPRGMYDTSWQLPVPSLLEQPGSAATCCGKQTSGKGAENLLSTRRPIS
jgi:hypothetical protein